jgi:hypothetical protein
LPDQLKTGLGLQSIHHAKHDRHQLPWLSGHQDTERNEVVDQLVTLRSEYPLAELDPGIAKKTARQQIHIGSKVFGESLTGLKEHKGFLNAPSVRRNRTVRTKQKPVIVRRKR